MAARNAVEKSGVAHLGSGGRTRRVRGSCLQVALRAYEQHGRRLTRRQDHPFINLFPI